MTSVELPTTQIGGAGRGGGGELVKFWNIDVAQKQTCNQLQLALQSSTHLLATTLRFVMLRHDLAPDLKWTGS